MATVGAVSNPDNTNINLGKAGRSSAGSASARMFAAS
jgi:ribosomal protein L2